MTKSDDKSNSARWSKARGLFKIPTAKEQITFWFVSAICVAADLWSKTAVFDWLSTKPYQEVTFNSWLRFVMRENAGAAFSMMHGHRFTLVAVSLIAFIAIALIFYSGIIKGKLLTINLALFFGGVVGNLYDRVFNDGLVRDFIDVYLKPFDYHWPTFNVADSLLCISLGIFVLHSIFSKDEKNAESKAGKTETSEED